MGPLKQQRLNHLPIFKKQPVFKFLGIIKSIESRGRSGFTEVSALEYKWDILVLIMCD